MTTTRRRKPAARKLLLPCIAIAMMTAMMAMESRARAHQPSITPASAPALPGR